MSDEAWVNSDVAARHLGYTPETIRRKANRAEIPGRKNKHGVWKFRLSQLDESLNAPVDPWALPARRRRAA